MTGRASTAGTGRVPDRQRRPPWRGITARPTGFSISQIADRLGRSPATVKAHFYDPTVERARAAVKARYVGVCRGLRGVPRNGKGDAYAYCKACHPGAIQARWTRQSMLDTISHHAPCSILIVRIDA